MIFYRMDYISKPAILKNNSFKKGDIVVLLCDDTVRYTILSLYGNNNAHAICAYYNSATQHYGELSIPTVALKKHVAPKRRNKPVTMKHSFAIM